MYARKVKDGEVKFTWKDDELDDVLNILLAGPEHEHYWDAFIDIESYTVIDENGATWDMFHSEDVYLSRANRPANWIER